MGDAGGVAVIPALAVPAFEDRLGGHFKLLHRVLGKIHLGMAAENGFELGGEGLPMGGGQSASLVTPALRLACSMAFSKASSAMPMTTDPNIWMRRR